MHRTRLAFSPIAAAIALVSFPLAAASAELYGGVGSTGGEIGIAQPLGDALSVRLEGNALSYRTHFTTNGIDYDARLRSGNAAAYVDGFLVGSVRVTGGALVGSRKFHGTATSLGGSVTINGVAYPVGPGDALDFDASFPRVTPYLGVGYGHHAGPGLQLYADAGVAYGRPKVTLSPTASLATKVSPSDLLAEQQSVQDKADRYRVYPVLKIGLGYRF
jgi:hypothetical protein